MPNAIDIYQPRYMAEVVRQTPPIPTYFRDTFFNRVITFPTERVDMDLMKGDRKILPYEIGRASCRERVCLYV